MSYAFSTPFGQQVLDASPFLTAGRILLY
jgi:hypothetical protein